MTNHFQKYVGISNLIICIVFLYHSIHRTGVDTLKQRQNGRHFQTTISNAFSWMKIYVFWISLKFVPTGPINNIPSSVQVMAWRRPGDNPLSEPMMDYLLTHICVTRPWWVKFIICYPYILWCIFRPSKYDTMVGGNAILRMQSSPLGI